MLSPSDAVRIRALPIAVLLMIFTGSLFFLSYTVYRDKLIADDRARIGIALDNSALALSNAMNRRFALLHGLKAFVESAITQGHERDILDSSFDLFASSLYSTSPGIRNFIVAPDGINTYVWPLETNRKAVGHNLLQDKRPQVRLDVHRALSQGTLTLSGPYELRQGGLGLVCRLAVFKGKAFWGLVTMVLDMPDVFAETKLVQAPAGLSMAIIGNDGNVFHGDKLVPASQPVIAPVLLPEGSWQLAFVPEQGWLHESIWSLAIFCVLGGTVTLGVGAVSFYLFGRNIRLEEAVTRRTAELSVKNDQLQHEIRLRKVAENRLLKEKNMADVANRTKSAFLATMSHDIRTPLSGAVGMNTLLQHTHLDKEQKQYVQAALDCSWRVLELLSDILDLSKIEAGKLELRQTSFSIATILHQAESVFGPACMDKGVIFSARMTPDLPKAVVGDEGRIMQILNNLISNAVKHTKSGRVDVCVSLVPGGQSEEQIVLFSVMDTGAGIPDEKMETLFDAYTQLQSPAAREGVGLGLSIVRRLVLLMNGSLCMTSEVGLGTEFHCSLPLRRVVMAPETVEPAADVTELPPMRVLVVEDEKINQLVLGRLLEKLGHAVMLADNGQQALDMLTEERFDLIFMDNQMPIMDGRETARAIRSGQAGNRDIPIIALTACAMTGDRERMLEAGMNDYLSKPIDMRTLLMIMRRWGPQAPEKSR